MNYHDVPAGGRTLIAKAKFIKKLRPAEEMAWLSAPVMRRRRAISCSRLRNPAKAPLSRHDGCATRYKALSKRLIDDRTIERLAAGSGAERVKDDDVDVIRDRVNGAIAEHGIEPAGMG